jgi:type II secretory pathway component GspD/PulD (secretin)
MKAQTKTWTDRRQDSLKRGDARINSDLIDERYDMDNEQYEETTTTFLESPPDSGNYISETKITPTRSISDTIASEQSIESTIANEFTDGIEEVRTAVLGADDFRIVLSALKQLNGVTVVSNPKIIVANNETATIHIGEKEPNIRGSVTPGQQGQANTTTYTLDADEPYFNFGITVDVTPTVNTASNITLDIMPKLTRFVRDKVAPDGTSYPVTTTKEIKTVFAMESGKTAAIGGLTETSEREAEKKVPLLGDIPLLGKYLFSHKTTQMVQAETIIFVTVGLAMPQMILRETGLPEDTELVRKRLIRANVEKKAFEADLQQLREVTDAKALETTSKARARLLKRRE